MTFKKPNLPYDLGALHPFVSEEQMDYHYNKHHEAYFKKLNMLVDGKEESEMDLETLIKRSQGAVFNNAAQCWNHTFFWHCMSPSGGGKPNGELLLTIERDFGSFEEFKKLATARAKETESFIISKFMCMKMIDIMLSNTSKLDDFTTDLFLYGASNTNQSSYFVKIYE